MKKSGARKSTLFLMELIFAILFFALSSAICLQLFVYAKNISDDSKKTTFAVSQVSSVAEVIKGSDSLDEITSSLSTAFSGYETISDQAFLVSFENQDYLWIKLDIASRLLTAQITYYRNESLNDEPYYELILEHYLMDGESL